jgi:hypothetical protein
MGSVQRHFNERTGIGNVAFSLRSGLLASRASTA